MPIEGRLPRRQLRDRQRASCKTMADVPTLGLLGGLVFLPSFLVYPLDRKWNFQSRGLDPFNHHPPALSPPPLAGIVGFLFVTHTTLSVPALMGGDYVAWASATANSNPRRFSFCEKNAFLHHGGTRWKRAIEAGFTRFPPRTHEPLWAMIIGMIPNGRSGWVRAANRMHPPGPAP